MAYLGARGDGVYPALSPTCIAQGLPACALLWLAQRRRNHAVGAYSGTAGLEVTAALAAGTRADAALSKVSQADDADWSVTSLPFAMSLLPRGSVKRNALARRFVQKSNGASTQSCCQLSAKPPKCSRLRAENDANAKASGVESAALRD